MVFPVLWESFIDQRRSGGGGVGVHIDGGAYLDPHDIDGLEVLYVNSRSWCEDASVLT